MLRSLSPGHRSKLNLLALGCLALIVVIGIGQTNVGAAALRLFDSPASPVSSPPEPTSAPAVAASATPPPPSASPGLPVPLWVIIVAAVVIVVVALVIGFSLMVRRRRG